MPKTTSTDDASSTVLVVGAGPTGLAAAICLARMGVPVRIVEVAESATTLSKALVVWRRSLLTLDPAIAYERFLERGVEVAGSRFFGDGRLGPVLELPRDRHELPPGVLIPQSETERLLGETLSSLGVIVERGTRLTAIAADADGAACELESPGGTERCRFDWVLGCDGAHSAVRHGLGIGFPGEAIERRWILGDIEIEVEDGVNPRPATREEERNLEPGWMHLDSGPAGTAAVFPMSDSRFRVIFDDGPPGESDARPATPRLLETLLHERTRLQWRIVETHWVSEFTVHERQVERYVHGRVLLCGDAAHVHSPAGGQGMNTGLQDAVNAAWKVALAATGRASSSLVETYHDERHPVGAKVLAMSGRMVRASMVANPVVKCVRNLGMMMALGIPSVRRRFAESLTEDDVDLADGPLAGAGHEAGHALPDAPIERDGGTRPATDLLRGATGALLLGPDAPSMSIRGLEAFPNLRVQRLGPAEAAVQKALRLRSGDAALVRPDGIIAAIGDRPAIERWLEAAGIA